MKLLFTLGHLYSVLYLIVKILQVDHLFLVTNVKIVKEEDFNTPSLTLSKLANSKFIMLDVLNK